MPTVRQSSFAAGALSPLLWGRTDLPRYAMGARRIRDFFVSKQGPLISRPGTKLVGMARADLANVATGGSIEAPVYVTAGGTIRLIPFCYSDTDTTQNAVLELGALYFRVWVNGEVVLNDAYTDDDDNPLDHGPTVYRPSDLRHINYVQSGDKLFLTCAGCDPCILERRSPTTWVFYAMDFSRPDPVDVSSASLIPQLDLTTLAAPSAAHQAKPWSFAVSMLLKDSRGLTYETKAIRVDVGQNYSNYSALGYYRFGAVVKDGASYFKNLLYGSQGIATSTFPSWSPVAAPTPATVALNGDTSIVADQVNPVTLRLFDPVTFTTDPNLICYRVYAGRAGVLGWIGDTRGPDFVWDGTDPDYTMTPPQGINPLKVFDDTGVLLRTEQPAAVGFFEDRLVLAGTAERSATWWASRTGDYLNFDQRLIAIDDESVQWNVAARRRERIRHVLGADRLFLFSDAGLWIAGGAQGTPLSPTSVDIKLQVDIGSDWVAPIQVGDFILWARDKGTGVRGLRYDLQQERFTSIDLSFPAEHLVLGKPVVDWCYQEDPWGVVWAVRSDGMLLSLTLAPDDQLFGWAEHGLCVGNDGSAGVVQSVCTIPEGDEDAVYVAMTGGGGGDWAGDGTHEPPAWILRMTTRQELPDRTPVPLDAWVQFDAVAVSGGAFTFGGLDHLEGRVVAALLTIDGVATTVTRTVSSGQIVVTASHGQTSASGYVGLPYTPELETLDLATTRVTVKSVNQVGIELATTGTVLVGQDFDNLDRTEVPAPDAVDNVARVSISGSWNTGGHVVLRVDKPTLVTVLGLTREVALGG